MRYGARWKTEVAAGVAAGMEGRGGRRLVAGVEEEVGEGESQGQEAGLKGAGGA